MLTSRYADRLLNFSEERVLDEQIFQWEKALRKHGIHLTNTYFIFGLCADISSTPLKDFLQKIKETHRSQGQYRVEHYILILDNYKENVWELMNTGLDDVIVFTDVADFIQYCQAIEERNEAIDNLLQSNLVKNNLVGESDIWKGFLREVISAALYSNGSIYFNGETGTGKELLARLVHTVDKKRSKNELIILDCTTIVPELAGSELFGHEKGSFTNAMQNREGAFALADKGSLFMDEIGDLPLRLQAEFLRVIQEKKYKKVGGNLWKKTDFRLISATNRNLHEMMEEGKFRSDLYFRISDYCFQVPSLAARQLDIPVLARHFLADALEGHPGKLPVFDSAVMEFLVNRNYLGNIRELKQLVQRIANNHHNHGTITPGDIPVLDRPTKSPKKNYIDNQSLYHYFKSSLNSGNKLQDIKKTTMAEAIHAALDLNENNKQKAAETLGITIRAIQKFLQLSKNNQLD